MFMEHNLEQILKTTEDSETASYREELLRLEEAIKTTREEAYEVIRKTYAKQAQYN
ncbi:hypothetical protein GCM10010404_85510 [Nonomuraea africana]